MIERIVLLADRPILNAADVERFLPDERAVAPAPQPVDTPDVQDHASVLAANMRRATLLPMRPYERVGSHSADALRETLRQCGGNKSRAAQMLGMTVRQFNYRWQKLGLANA